MNNNINKINKIKKVTSLVNPFLSNNDQQYMNIALTKHSFTGPLCDDEGYSQHKGECWNDTLQEIFFFSDGIKDYTQPLFYDLDTSSDYLTKLVSSKLFPDTGELTDAEQNTVNKLVKYIRLMKIRFVTHYNYLVDANTRNIPILSKIHKSKRRLSAICGIGAAKHITNLYKGNSNTYAAGLIPPHKKELFNNLNFIFKIPYVVTDFKPSDTLANINGILFSSNFMRLTDVNTYTYKGAHSFGFLKCNSIWKFYDDNERTGLIDIDENLVSLYMNDENVAIGVTLTTDSNGDKISTMYVLKYVIHGVDKSSVATVSQYYENNKWNDWTLEWDKTHPFKRIYTKTLFYIVRPKANLRRSGGGITKRRLRNTRHNKRRTNKNKSRI